MTNDAEKFFEKNLRWMNNNVLASAGIYNTPSGNLRIDPNLELAGDRIVRVRDNKIPEFKGWENNSATALVCCCYIDALGKVVKEGKGGSERRFRKFIRTHMEDLRDECDRKGKRFSIGTLYKRYRCGFAHQFADENAIWDRLGRGADAEYWFEDGGRVGINVERLAQGFLDGLELFQDSFRARVQAGEATFEDFRTWLMQQRGAKK